jgi:MFS transporter, DHA1 family, inner membrane transport protein
MPLFSLMLLVFCLTTGEFVIAGILPDVATHLSVSIPAAGLLITAYAVGMIVGGPVVTLLTTRMPRRTLVAGLITVSIAGNLSSALAPGYTVLLVSRFVAGLVVATFFAVAIATAISTAAPGKQASAVAKVALGLNLGLVLGTPVGTFIGHNLGWRATFASVAGASLVALLLALRFLAAGRPTADGPAFKELRVFGDRDVQLAILLTAVGNLGVMTVFSYIAPLLVDVSGFAPGAIPVLLLLYGAGAVAGNFLGGMLADRALLPSLVGLLSILTVVLAVAWLVAGSRTPMAILVFVLGALAFAIIPGMQTRVVTAASAAPTLAVAVNASGFQLAAAFAGWLGGSLIAGPGPRSIYLAAALLTLAGVALTTYTLHHDRPLTPTPST